MVPIPNQQERVGELKSPCKQAEFQFGVWLKAIQRCVGLIKLAGAMPVSTDRFETGGKAEVDQAAIELRLELDEASAEELAAQEDLFEPLTSEELALAADGLGHGAGALSVLRAARVARRQGRPRGAKNKSSQDLVAYLSQFGPDPLVAAMRIVNEDELAMVGLSHQVDPTKKRLSFAEARALRIRCIELLAPYFHGKQPVRVDATITGVRIIEEIGELKRARDAGSDGVRGVLPMGAESNE